MITQTKVLARQGWSKTLLLNLLGDPDLQKKVFGRSNLSCLYLMERVVAAEKSDAFLVAQEQLAKRKFAAAKAVATKINNLLAAIDAMDVFVIRHDALKVRKQAIDSYNDFNSDSDNPASVKSNTAFLDRICVNYIRHELTSYDDSLAEAAGKTGVAVAVIKIRAKIFAEIAVAYPVFGSECERQRFALRD